MTQFRSFPQQKVQPQIQTQAALPQRYTPVQPPFRHSQQPHLPASHKVIISKSTHNKVPVQQQVEQRLDIHQRIRVPPPPGRFVPHLADIYGHPMPDRPYLPPKFFINSSIESLPDGPYEAEEKNENGKHRSYIEDTAKTSPINKIGRISKPKIIKPSPEAQLRVSGQWTTSDDGSFVCCSIVIGREIREIPKSEIRRPSHRSRPALQQNSTTVHPVHMSKSSFFNTIPKPVVAATGSKLSKNPNVAFLNCCKAAKVAKSCERICNFDILNKKTLTGMFLGTDPCPQSYGLDLLQCAAQSEDHTTCCQDRGVHTTTAGDKCLGFCNMRPGVNFQVRGSY
ncbi:DB module [Dictyocaulus viviparus]|uniref:DB module n=1 Tax=Dictyocaulus viviparus TaxID=29172 RepID=A0A0D8XLH6_DICVI|nr:DB module [Dictyocaulus viviparus]